MEMIFDSLNIVIQVVVLCNLALFNVGKNIN